MKVGYGRLVNLPSTCWKIKLSQQIYIDLFEGSDMVRGAEGLDHIYHNVHQV